MTVSPCGRVLVVDDDVRVCEFLEQALRRRAFTVISETSALAALDRLKIEDFDVVVCDLEIKDPTGMAFMKRAMVIRPEIMVIMTTGSMMQDGAIDAVVAGAWDFLVKPIEPKLLTVSIERACEHRQLKKELFALRAQGQAAPVSSESSSCAVP